VKAVGSGSISCDEDREFWITDNEGTISVGVGRNPRYNQRVSYKNPIPYDPRFILVSSWNNTGKWFIRELIMPLFIADRVLPTI
jgi:hypothetical protein